MVTITSGPAHVIASGTTTTFGGHPLLVHCVVREDPERAVAFELTFSTDSESNGPDLLTEVDGDLVRLRCINFEGGYGRGTALPVGLTVVDEQMILLHFRALRHGESVDWTVHWTLYRAPRTSPG